MRGKCFMMHVGKEEDKCIKIKVHDENIIQVKEIFYLGEILSSDGRNTKNLRERVPNGMRIVNEIRYILKTLSLGPHFFNLAVMLINAILVNGMIYNIESW